MFSVNLGGGDEQPAPRLLPVLSVKLERAVSLVLRFDGRKQSNLAGWTVGKTTATHLVHCLTGGTRGSAAREGVYVTLAPDEHQLTF